MPALDLLKGSNHKKEMQEFDMTIKTYRNFQNFLSSLKKACLESKFSSNINMYAAHCKKNDVLPQYFCLVFLYKYLNVLK